MNTTSAQNVDSIEYLVSKRDKMKKDMIVLEEEIMDLERRILNECKHDEAREEVQIYLNMNGLGRSCYMCTVCGNRVYNPKVIIGGLHFKYL